MKIKGQQTAEEVVETALRAVQSGRTKIVPGFANYVGSILGGYLPAAVVTRVMAKTMRSRFQSEDTGTR
jgi:hypothetical protein